MDGIYRIMERLLPFDFIRYDFIKNALLAVLILTPLFGMLGTMIVNNKMAFFSDALGHSALTGMAAGIVFGIADPTFAMVCFAMIFALFLNTIRHSGIVASDTVISVFSSLSTAIGLVILSRNGSFAKYSALLVGDILSISPSEIGRLFLIWIVALLFWHIAFNKLHAISLNASLARSRRMPVLWVDNLFVVLIAIIVMLSIRIVGILIINALLILPAASARNISANMREYHLFSILFSIFAGVLGLIFAYYFNMAAGPTIAVIASLIFFVMLLVRPMVRC